MRRRARSLSFLLGALLAAGAAAAIADGYGSRAARGYGPLRPVVVVAAELAADRPIGAREMSSALEVRRVPERFVPEGALAVPERALGLAPRADLTPGSYLLATELVPPSRSGGRRRIAPGRTPVEIAVGGAGALLASGSPPVGATVDVVVTSEPSGSGSGRTYVAASGVRLLALRRGAGGAGASGTAAATLALTRAQALRLIAAQSFARSITVLPRG